MHRSAWIVALAAILAAGCAGTVNVEQERSNLMAVDREWSQSAKDIDKFMSYFASDARAYPPGMPVQVGADTIRKAFTEMISAPGFSLQWTATRAEVSASGDLGHTSGTYEMAGGGASEKGKYLTVWKKQADGSWKVTDDIFNADGGPSAAAAPHVMMAPGAIKWVDGPPSLPPGAKVAVISGDPAQPQPFVLRVQTPAGYKVAPHWHPTTESLTILSGTVALGMGDTWDQAAMKDLGVGGFAAVPAEMRHSFLSKTAATFQVHAMGPFAVNYVNPADDPSKQQK